MVTLTSYEVHLRQELLCMSRNCLVTPSHLTWRGFRQGQTHRKKKRAR